LGRKRKGREKNRKKFFQMGREKGIHSEKEKEETPFKGGRKGLNRKKGVDGATRPSRGSKGKGSMIIGGKFRKRKKKV